MTRGLLELKTFQIISDVSISLLQYSDPKYFILKPRQEHGLRLQGSQPERDGGGVEGVQETAGGVLVVHRVGGGGRVVADLSGLEPGGSRVADEEDRQGEHREHRGGEEGSDPNDASYHREQENVQLEEDEGIRAS